MARLRKRHLQPYPRYPGGIETASRVKLHDSNVIFVNFHTLLQSIEFVVVLVLVPRPRLNSDSRERKVSDSIA
jgi:hypothetical protein